MKRFTWVAVLVLLLLVLCSGVAFADDSQQFAAPTDLHWGTSLSPGYIYWTDTINTTCEIYKLIIYDASGEIIHSTNYSGLIGPQFRVDDFRYCDVTSGNYRFSIQAVDNHYDDNTPKNSEIVYSDFWTYTKPSQKLATPKNVKLAGSVLTWDNPENNRVEVQFGLVDAWGNDRGDGRYSWGHRSNEQDVRNAFQETGVFRFRVRFVSDNITKICNSDWSEYVYFRYKGDVKKNYKMNAGDNGDSLDIVVDEGHFSVTATGDLSEDQPLLIASYDTSGRFLGLDVLTDTSDKAGIDSDASSATAIWIGSEYQPKCKAQVIELDE